MDPNETLHALRLFLGGDHSGYEPNREETAIIHDEHPTKSLRDLHSIVTDAESLFQSMDEWLKRGGFIPRDWQP